MSLLSECLTESLCSFWENSIAGQPDLGYILCVLKYFGNMPCTIRSNEIIGEEELSKCCVVLDGLAQGNASIHHDFIVCHV